MWPPPLPRGLCPVCRAPAPTPRLWTRAHSARPVLTSLSQPLGPSSSASSSRPGRAAWASTWPRRTRSSSTTRTGTRTMTSRSVARRRAPCGCLGGPGFVGLPVAVSGARLPGQPCGLSAPKGTWGGSWRLCPPLQLLTVRRRKRPREGRGCAQGHTATGSLSPHPQDQGHGGRPDEGVSLVTQRGPVWEGTRRTEGGGQGLLEAGERRRRRRGKEGRAGWGLGAWEQSHTHTECFSSRGHTHTRASPAQACAPVHRPRHGRGHSDPCHAARRCTEPQVVLTSHWAASGPRCPCRAAVCLRHGGSRSHSWLTPTMRAPRGCVTAGTLHAWRHA